MNPPAKTPELFSDELVQVAEHLRDAVDALEFAPPITHVYNPLHYAWASHRLYLERYGASPKRVIFLGMNPGPFGMVQTGVPFGEVDAVRGWMGIVTPVDRPAHEHPKRPIQGFQCPRSEVSGRRLWGLFAARFPNAKDFFAEHFVVNYCPLAFLEASGRNFTPDKLPARESQPLLAACDAHVRAVVRILQPKWLIGVGDFAEKRLRAVLGEKSNEANYAIGKILHPSPASPAANKDWAGLAQRQLESLGVW